MSERVVSLPRFGRIGKRERIVTAVTVVIHTAHVALAVVSKSKVKDIRR